MNSRSIRACILCFIVAFEGLLIGLAGTSNNDLFADSSYLSIDWSSRRIGTIISFASNAYIYWRPDWLIQYVVHLFNYPIALGLLHSILGFGTFVWLSRRGASDFVKYFASILIAPTLVSIFGLDLIVISVVCYLPWLIWLTWEFLEGKSTQARNILLLFILCERLLSTAQTFSWICVLFALSLSIYPYIKLTPWGARARSTREILAWCLIPIVFALAALSSNSTLFPSYPRSATVVPKSTMEIHPLIGPDLKMPIIDYQWINPLVLNLSVSLCLILGIFWLFSRRATSSIYGSVFKLAITCAFLCLWTSVDQFPEIQKLSPLVALSLIVPNAHLFPLSIIFLSFGLYFSLIWICARGYYFGVLLVATSLILSSSLATRVYNPTISSHFFERYKSHFDEHKALVSPSFSIIKRYDFQALSISEVLRDAKPVNLANLTANVHASSNSESVGLLMDKKSRTRWTPVANGQMKPAWIKIELNHPKILAGIVLGLGKFLNDYPRNFRVSVSRACSEPQTSWDESFNYTPWTGPLIQNTEKLLYYGPLNKVRVVFQEPKLTKCILIENIGDSAKFDWSVAELSLLIIRLTHNSETSLIEN